VGEVSEEAKDLITSCLVADPQERPTAKEVLAHPWLAGVELAGEKGGGEGMGQGGAGEGDTWQHRGEGGQEEGGEGRRGGGVGRKWEAQPLVAWGGPLTASWHKATVA